MAVCDDFEVLVVGAGPIGLATALALSSPPLQMNVCVIEKASASIPKGTRRYISTSLLSQYDPAKAYLYLLNNRGQSVLHTLLSPHILTALQLNGARQAREKCVVVPGSPQTPVTMHGVGDGDDSRKPESRDQSTACSFWVARHTMIQILEDAVWQQENLRKSKGASYGRIELRTGVMFDGMDVKPEKCSSGGKIRVDVIDTRIEGRDIRVRFDVNLVVGADGINSAVRTFLHSSAKFGKNLFQQKRTSRFQVTKFASPASGMRLKVLQLPTKFTLPNPDGSMVKIGSDQMCSIRSIFVNSPQAMSLGLMPVAAPDASVRPANVIIPACHISWGFTSGKECRAWFARAFPRIDWDTMILDDAEWERFVFADYITFPPCQYCTDLQLSAGQVGVALVGDAVHAFPPDTGQGINAGLGDVQALYLALSGQKIMRAQLAPRNRRPVDLSEGLRLYEKEHRPEVRAVIRFARCGPLHSTRIGKTLWAFNVTLRSFLNKISFGIIPNAAIAYAVGSKASFREVMRRCDLTTVGMISVGLIALSSTPGIVIKFFTIPCFSIVMYFS